MKPPLLCKNCGAPIRYQEKYKDYIHKSHTDEPGELYNCRFTKGYEHMATGILAEPATEKPSSAIDELFS